MFRERQPLRKYHGCSGFYHTELQSTDNGVRVVTVDDCEKLPPVSDFDLELNLRSGENLKEVSSIIMNHGRVNLDVVEQPKTLTTQEPPKSED